MSRSSDYVAVAVVGCGKIFNDAHRMAYVNLASTNNVVIAVCDLRQDLIKDQVKWLKENYEKLLITAKKKNKTNEIERLKFGIDNIKGYTSYEKMLDDIEGKCELVDNCTPGRLHVPLSVQAMEHGYHAMAEKPPGLNWWDVKRLVNAEEKTGKYYQLNENVCYERPVQAMRRVIAEGELGAILEIEVHFGHGGPYIPNFFGESGLPHFIDPLWSGGGCLQDLGPHGISRAFWPVGTGARVLSCETKILERRISPRMMSGEPFDNKLDDWVEATLEMLDPRTGQSYIMRVTTSWCQSFPFPFSIEGEGGILSISQDPTTKIDCPTIMADEGDRFFPIEKDQWEPDKGYEREIQIFCNNLLHDKPSDTPAEYALRLEECLSIQYYSKLVGRKVTIEELEQWGEKIAANHSDGQETIDEIALSLTNAVDQL